MLLASQSNITNLSMNAPSSSSRPSSTATVKIQQKSMIDSIGVTNKAVLKNLKVRSKMDDPQNSDKKIRNIPIIDEDKTAFFSIASRFFVPILVLICVSASWAFPIESLRILVANFGAFLISSSENLGTKIAALLGVGGLFSNYNSIIEFFFCKSTK